MPEFLAIPLATLVTFSLAWFVIVLVPGPTVTVIVANSLRAGASAGMANVAGTQLAVGSMILILAFGLETVLGLFASFFFWIKIAGAAYLVWIGIKLLRSSFARESTVFRAATGGRGRNEARFWKYFWQGFAVLWSNPKALFFFGAFIPQFVSPQHDPVAQVLTLGAVAMIIGAICDGAYAILAGQTGSLLTESRIRWSERIAGLFLLGGGIWLALSRRT